MVVENRVLFCLCKFVSEIVVPKQARQKQKARQKQTRQEHQEGGWGEGEKAKKAQTAHHRLVTNKVRTTHKGVH